MFYIFLTEIKNRIILIIYCWLCCLLVCYIFKDNLLYILIKPNLIIYVEKRFYFIFTDLSEPFYTYLKLILFISNQCLYIYVLYNTIMFVLPALYSYEYYILVNKILTINTIIIISIIILYKIILPWSGYFFLSIQQNKNFMFYFEAKLNDYLEYIINIYHIFMSYICILIILIYLTILKYSRETVYTQIKKYRKFIYLILILFSSIITPPDVLSQLLMSLLNITIFEINMYFILIKNNYNI